MRHPETHQGGLVDASPWSRSAGWRSPAPRRPHDRGLDPDATRRRIGAGLYVAFIVLGAWLNVSFFRREIFEGWRAPEAITSAMVAGAVPAFAMLFFYMLVPKLLDRFDPEPWWALAVAFFWGAVVATGVSSSATSFIHEALSGVTGEKSAALLTKIVAGPVVEETMKGLILWAFFYFLRREFDGIVDGIMYASFCALGFATIENVTYYARAILEGSDVFHGTFFIRAIVAPWGHPLYTCMTGIGLGIRRESSSPAVRAAAPALGLTSAILLHALWNYVPNLGNHAFFVSLLFWFVFVGLFLIVVITLVVRKGRIIREHLEGEVPLGTMTAADVAFVTRPFSHIQTLGMRRGALWRALIGASGRLALSKWHAERAIRRAVHRASDPPDQAPESAAPLSISIDFISPLRDEVQRLSARIHAPHGSLRRSDD